MNQEFLELWNTAKRRLTENNISLEQLIFPDEFLNSLNARKKPLSELYLGQLEYPHEIDNYFSEGIPSAKVSRLIQHTGEEHVDFSTLADLATPDADDGFTIEKIPGPKGKREMLRAKKLM